jgi:hypothetical protein
VVDPATAGFQDGAIAEFAGPQAEIHISVIDREPIRKPFETVPE